MPLTEVAPGLRRWTAWHEEWKAEVGCVAVETDDGLVLIDPLDPPRELGRPEHALVTVFFHARSTKAPNVWAHERMVRRLASRGVEVNRPFTAGDSLPGGSGTESARSGEIVYWLPDEGGRRRRRPRSCGAKPTPDDPCAAPERWLSGKATRDLRRSRALQAPPVACTGLARSRARGGGRARRHRVGGLGSASFRSSSRRGVAVRVIRALHELGVEAVAVYSTADEDALHVRLADRAVRIGPPPAAESYLSIPALIAAAETTGCEAVHPGYGFVSENAGFVRACEDNELVFIGPPADVMERMGDKARAKAEMRAAGVPLVPGTEGITGPDDARAAAGELGFPVFLKAAAGGGGKGMRVVTEPGELQAAYERASAEAQAAFGDGSTSRR